MTDRPGPPRPDYPRMAGQPAGPAQQAEHVSCHEPVGASVTAVADAATEYLQQQADIHKQSAMGLAKTSEALHQVQQAAIQGALIATGNATEALGYATAGPTSNTGSVGSASATLTIQPAESPSEAADLEKERSKKLHYMLGGATSLVSFLWITYFHADAPPEILAVIPVIAMAVQQAIAAHVNNRT